MDKPTLTPRSGISLIELLVALSIIVILVLLSIPLFSSFINKHRVTGAADNLYSFLRYARTEAIKRNTNVYVSFISGDSWCYGMNPGSACSCNVANSCALGTISAPAAGQTSLSATGLNSNSIYFESTRGAASNSATLTFALYGQTPFITITIKRLGSLQICSSEIGGYQGC